MRKINSPFKVCWMNELGVDDGESQKWIWIMNKRIHLQLEKSGVALDREKRRFNGRLKMLYVVINNLHTFSIRNRLSVPSPMDRFLGTRTHFLRVSTFFSLKISFLFFLVFAGKFVNWNWWDVMMTMLCMKLEWIFWLTFFETGLYTHQNYLNKLNRIFFPSRLIAVGSIVFHFERL